jgi:hypothetical protein
MGGATTDEVNSPLTVFKHAPGGCLARLSPEMAENKLVQASARRGNRKLI